MCRAATEAHYRAKIIWGIVLFSFGYIVLALACLCEWGKPSPWSRVDVFSGGFLGLIVLALVLDFVLGLGQTAFRSQETLREASGIAYDARTIVMTSLVSVGDTLVFLDYGHWHLVAVLERHGLQTVGLVLAVMTGAWLMWVDARLARYFAAEPSARTVIQDGPFRYVRHPRYAGVLAMRIAFALALASVWGWILVLAWYLLLARRIRLEETHMRQVFGRDYEVYAERTRRLIPGIY